MLTFYQTRSKCKRIFFPIFTIHCWLEDIRNLKINDRKIATYFWYLWIFLTLPQVSFFWYVFGFQVALQSFFLKVGILSWNFLWTILMWKKLALEAFESISCPKISSKQQYLKFENFLTIFEKAENDLKNWFLWLETAWIIFKYHNFPKICPFFIFKEEVKTMVFLVFPNFDLIFGQNMDS